MNTFIWLSLTFIIIFILVYKYNHHNQSKKQYIKLLNNKISFLTEKEKELSNQIQVLNKKYIKKISDISNLENKEKNLILQYEKLKTQSILDLEKHKAKIVHQYIDIQKNFQEKRNSIKKEQNQLFDKIKQIKNRLTALTAAQIEENKRKDKINFYKIQISTKQQSDIKLLQEWKYNLFQPSIVSKIIWSSYIIKPTSDLCNRVLGKDPVCGIYKITDLLTNQHYIGQSVNIADRWKNHIKNGLGINTSISNKLYTTMQEHGVWNFTFELLQKCSRDKLNERQRFWIDTYSSDKIGLNIKKGINK